MRDESSLLAIACCIGCSGAIIGVGAVISYIVFGVLFLVQDRDEATSCGDSLIWEYSLVSLILAWSRVGAWKKEEGVAGLFLIACVVLLDAGLACWGGLELFSDSGCHNNFDLYYFALVTFVLQLLTPFVIVVATSVAFISATTTRDGPEPELEL